MNIKKYFRRSIHYLLKGVPEQHITAQISYLSPNGLLKERTALITGGTSGIGFAIAKCFLQAGAKVIITGRTEDKLKEKCLELEKFESCRGCVSGFVWDVMDISHFEACLNRCLEKVGKIDILVNNAGTLGGEFGHTTETEYDTVLDTNLKGAFFLSQCIGKYMKENGIRGNILNIASSSSLRPATSAYTLSKWGIRGLTVGLAKLLIPCGIVVNGLAPGPTATPMLGKFGDEELTLASNPIGRYVTPEEIANMAVVLVSNMGRSIVGDIVYMTGGAGIVTLDDIKYSF